MAAIPRKTQQIFGGSLSAPGNIAKYASLAQGAPAYSLDLAQIQTASWLNGLAAGLITAGGLQSPAMEDFNALFYLLTTQLAYGFQSGIAEWDSGTEYETSSFVRVGDVVYVSKVDANTNHDVTDTNYWKTYSSTLNNARGIAKAWVCFDGRTGAIYDSFNVSSVNRTATGCYFINFAIAMLNIGYVFSGSCGTAPGNSYMGGDDNYVTAGAPGKLSSKLTTGMTVFCYDRPNTATEDSSMISVLFFGA